MGSMWLYTVLRFGLFGVLCLILWLVGLPVVFAAVLAAVASLPISYVVLKVPRQRFADNIEARAAQRRQARAEFDHELDPGNSEQ
jgi:hypothetical protein